MKSVTVVYIHVPNDPHHAALAELYVKSILEHPGGYEHRNLIVSQGNMPSAEMQLLFGRLTGCSYFVHDDSGFDIGGYIAAAAQIHDEVMVCMGGSAQVRKAGWLARMMEAWEKHGPGLYGSLSSYQIRPHLNTTGFWCAPEMLLQYPSKVVTKKDRYEFEHGLGSFWKQLHDAGKKVMLVTWCGEYGWKEWRQPHNILCRGNQENCLTYFRISYDYEHYRQHDIQEWQKLEQQTDNCYLQLRYKLTNQLTVARAAAAAGDNTRAIKLYLDALGSVQQSGSYGTLLAVILEVARAFLTLDQGRGRKLLETGASCAVGINSYEGQLAIDELAAEYRQYSTPAVSIIIPVFNNLPLTRACLASLSRTGTTIAHEIIVVDNGSAAGTAALLKAEAAAGRLRAIHNLGNLGFAAACNQGAQAARGQYLLFLNNDTEVQAGWLEALVQAARRPQTGVVGAKLLYSDGRIQHAGIGFINGVPDHPHRHAPANAPEVNQFRELDMVTGACLLIRSELFRQLAGFDEAYRNGVEDIDLCLRARAAGWKVAYEPKAVVNHLEGQSAGRFDHVNENLQLFFSRWGKLFDQEQRFLPPQPAKLMTASRSLFLASGTTQTRAVSVDWIGSFLDYGSLSHVNRELSRGLPVSPGIKLHRVSNGSPALPAFQDLSREVSTIVSPNAAVTVRHAWPPDWRRPEQGALVIIQPWEFGILPEDWVRQSAQVQELWVPSKHVCEVYVKSGVAGDKVKVVPNGIDPTVFRPDATPRILATNKRFKFLFVGGTIHRKGPDVLLAAYLKTFTAADDVCLVIKDFGGQSVYVGQTLEARIKAAQADPAAPEILYLNEELPPEALPGLYTACDSLVHPYRGEGFGLPILEAMACGLPVIITAGGSADDFAPDEFAYRIPALKKFIGDSISGMKLVGQGWLLEPDAAALEERMKWVVTHRDEARGKGLAASEYVRREWTWERAATVVEVRLRELIARQDAVAQKSPTQPVRQAAPIVLQPCALQGQLTEARQFLQQKKLPAAWGATRAALKHRPFHPEAYLLLAEIAQAAQEPGAARSCAEFARHIAPEFRAAKKFLKGKFYGHAKHDWLVLPEEIGKHNSERRHHLSVCLIVKNEEQFLDQCLKSVKGLADQIVVVDTGSTDRTVDIAKEHGAQVHSFAWCDDFSAARNAALEHATGDWILMLDADEELPSEAYGALRKLLRTDSVMAWRLPIIDVGREDAGCCYVPRLFRNAPGLFYVGRIHEQVFGSLETRRQEWGLENRLGDAALRHHGYRPDVVKDRNKIERNLRLLEQAVAESPDDPNLVMNHGLELTRSGSLDAGVEQYQRAFEILSRQPAGTVVPELREMLLTQMSTHLMAQKWFNEIVRVLTSPLANTGGLTASLHFNLGLAYFELKQFSEAAGQMRQCLAKRNQPALAPINQEIRKAGPRHCLALCLDQMGETDAAAEEFRLAIEADPQSRSVRCDHARFLAAHERQADALNLLFALANEKPSEAQVWLQGGQVALSRPEFLEVALDWTTEAARNLPDDPAVVQQQAEALMLAGRSDEALPLWRRGSPASDDVVAAALVICETVAGENQFAPVSVAEVAVSREFVKWYQKLLQFSARLMVEALNANVETLEKVLPTAARILADALAEANETAADEAGPA